MKKELVELQKELLELEKEEIPTRMAAQAQSAKQSLKTIDDLRKVMQNVTQSSRFHDLETKSKLDLKDILSKVYTKETRLQDSTTQSEDVNKQKLKQAIQQLLSENSQSQNDNGLVKDQAQINSEIELVMQVNYTPEEI